MRLFGCLWNTSCAAQAIHGRLAVSVASQVGVVVVFKTMRHSLLRYHSSGDTMPTIAPPYDLPYDLPPVFRGNSISRFSLRQYRSRRSIVTMSSWSNINWLGSDLGDFLYWVGERLLDLWVEVAIRIRLRAIRSTLVRKKTVNHTDPSQVDRVHRICYDLLELCRYVAAHL